MPAQLEEMIVEAHTGQFQYLGPDRRHLLLARGDGRYMAFERQAGIRFGQCLAVELTVGGQRQAVEEQPLRGHHVVRQTLAQRGFIHLRCLRRGADQVSDQPVVIGQHHGFAYAVELTQAGFDFTQLDTETPDLDLMVDTADVFHHAVRLIACQVAGTVQAFARSPKRVGHEAFGGQRRLPVVTARQADTTDQQLTGHTLGAWRETGIENEQAGIGDGPSNERQCLVQTMSRRPDGGFRRAIEIPQRALQVEHALGQIGGQRFATAQAGDATQ
ncbi:hypothetical protein PFLuk1_02877 [Pseudomonas fluorescens]|nr:hypothetical protein PFLuk1_02877 [Pseudomonas fluorescens]